MINFESTLHVQEPEDIIQQRIERYFKQNRYQAKRDSNNDVYYERGSRWRNYIAFNSGEWHAFATVSVDSADDETHMIDVQLRVDTEGQLLVVESERRYWQTEFDLMVAYLETGKSKKEDILGEMGRANATQSMLVTLGLFSVIPILIIVLLVVGFALLNVRL